MSAKPTMPKRRVSFGETTVDDLKKPGDMPEIEIEPDDQYSRLRLRRRSSRPSVVANNTTMLSLDDENRRLQCVRPDLWYRSNSLVFGCARCTEQDVCPKLKRVFSAEALTRGVHKIQALNYDGEITNHIKAAAKYHGVKLKILGMPVKEEVEEKEKEVVVKKSPQKRPMKLTFVKRK